MVSIILEAGLILTMLAYAVSLRRAYDRKPVELAYLASTDPLTGLANRAELEQSLRQCCARAERFGRRGALVFIDLDGLKRVNDRLGHEAGDALLRAQAARARTLTRGIDIAARVGRDEFVMLLSEFEAEKGAEILSHKALTALRAPVLVGGEQVEASASIGVAEFPACGSSPDVLLMRADEAMYAAKRAGGARIFCAQANGVAEVV